MTSHVIGLDFGSDSVRCLIVNTSTGEEISSAVCYYPRWKEGRFCNPSENRYRQHPLDHLESLEKCIKDALAACPPGVAGSIKGISLDTTASTPVVTDRNGTPLALLPGFEEDPDAMFILWKDHTAMDEADRINEVAGSSGTDYTKYCGGSYSCEWVWAKMLHVLRVNPRIREAAWSWVEHGDWISAVLTGSTDPLAIRRSRCIAGHKGLWNAEWGGLPTWSFFHEVDPLLDVFQNHLYDDSWTSDNAAGTLSPFWAEKLGLKGDIAVGVGGIDCHVGAVGAGIVPGTLVKVMGTSTCDIFVGDKQSAGGKAIKGICGQVDGSVVPGLIGFEAGQSAFGDVYAWFSRFCGKDIPELTEEAGRLPLTENDMVALDWFNGRRSPDADPRAKATVCGLTMATTPGQFFKALVEATAFGSRAINERFVEEGIPVKEIVAVGGISKKSPYVMQAMSDIMGVPIKILDSDQACALGAAMFAAVISGIYPTVAEAQKAMKPSSCATYVPDMSRHAVYDVLYRKYQALGRL